MLGLMVDDARLRSVDLLCCHLAPHAPLHSAQITLFYSIKGDGWAWRERTFFARWHTARSHLDLLDISALSWGEIGRKMKGKWAFTTLTQIIVVEEWRFRCCLSQPCLTLRAKSGSASIRHWYYWKRNYPQKTCTVFLRWYLKIWQMYK